jgi:hypothetical protein
MANQILVPVKSYRAVEYMIPYIREVAENGTRIVFLIRYPVDNSMWLKDHWVTTESTRAAIVGGRFIIERYSAERQVELAERILAPCRTTLQRMGIEVIVNVYTGSLANAVKRYRRATESTLIMRAPGRFSLMSLFHKAIAFRGFFKSVAHPPVVLLRPND